MGKQAYIMTYGTWKRYAGALMSGACLPIDRSLEPHELTDESPCAVLAETHDALHATLEREAQHVIPHIGEIEFIGTELANALAPLGVIPLHRPIDVHKILARHHPAFHPRNL